MDRTGTLHMGCDADKYKHKGRGALIVRILGCAGNERAPIRRSKQQGTLPANLGGLRFQRAYCDFYEIIAMPHTCVDVKTCSVTGHA